MLWLQIYNHLLQEAINKCLFYALLLFYFDKKSMGSTKNFFIYGRFCLSDSVYELYIMKQFQRTVATRTGQVVTSRSKKILSHGIHCFLESAGAISWQFMASHLISWKTTWSFVKKNQQMPSGTTKCHHVPDRSAAHFQCTKVHCRSAHFSALRWYASLKVHCTSL